MKKLIPYTPCATLNPQVDNDLRYLVHYIFSFPAELVIEILKGLPVRYLLHFMDIDCKCLTRHFLMALAAKTIVLSENLIDLEEDEQHIIVPLGPEYQKLLQLLSSKEVELPRFKCLRVFTTIKEICDLGKCFNKVVIDFSVLVSLSNNGLLITNDFITDVVAQENYLTSFPISVLFSQLPVIPSVRCVSLSPFHSPFYSKGDLLRTLRSKFPNISNLELTTISMTSLNYLERYTKRDELNIKYNMFCIHHTHIGLVVNSDWKYLVKKLELHFFYKPDNSLRLNTARFGWKQFELTILDEFPNLKAIDIVKPSVGLQGKASKLELVRISEANFQIDTTKIPNIKELVLYNCFGPLNKISEQSSNKLRKLVIKNCAAASCRYSANCSFRLSSDNKLDHFTYIGNCQKFKWKNLDNLNCLEVQYTHLNPPRNIKNSIHLQKLKLIYQINELMFPESLVNFGSFCSRSHCYDLTNIQFPPNLQQLYLYNDYDQSVTDLDSTNLSELKSLTELTIRLTSFNSDNLKFQKYPQNLSKFTCVLTGEIAEFESLFEYLKNKVNWKPSMANLLIVVITQEQDHFDKNVTLIIPKSWGITNCTSFESALIELSKLINDFEGFDRGNNSVTSLKKDSNLKIFEI